jgi:hypothetical protein
MGNLGTNLKSWTIKTVCKVIGLRMMGLFECSCWIVTSLSIELYADFAHDFGPQFAKDYCFLGDPYSTGTMNGYDCAHRFQARVKRTFARDSRRGKT